MQLRWLSLHLSLIVIWISFIGAASMCCKLYLVSVVVVVRIDETWRMSYENELLLFLVWLVCWIYIYVIIIYFCFELRTHEWVDVVKHLHSACMMMLINNITWELQLGDCLVAWCWPYVLTIRPCKRVIMLFDKTVAAPSLPSVQSMQTWWSLHSGLIAKWYPLLPEVRCAASYN